MGGVITNSKFKVETDTITLTSPTKAGYNFTGVTGTGLSEKTETVTIPKGSIENKNYTANWEIKNYGINYDLQGGTLASGESNPITYNVEAEKFTLNNPTKERWIYIIYRLD